MKTKKSLAWSLALLFALFGLTAGDAFAACRDAKVLVHGNAGYPSHFDSTYNRLRSAGYSSSEIIRPNWGSKTCPTCNNHSGWEETPVRDAINTALSRSCTGKIDVIGHSMGVTLAAQQILKLGAAGRVDTFVGIAGALRGLNSCGTYPWNVPNPTCGSMGLSKNSNLINYIKYKRFGNKMYSMKSYNDPVVCAGGWAFCYVDGTHTSNIWYQNSSYTNNALGHMGLVLYTSGTQYNYISN